VCFSELALAYYDEIIAKCYLEIHKDKVDFYENKIKCVDENDSVGSSKGEDFNNR
jgi:hypothetical protein